MRKIPMGPTYEEMLYPEKIEGKIRHKAIKAKVEDELDPINLFNITWKNSNNEVNKIVLPKELTGVAANIIVMLGKDFPSGSHKVGPAYATLMEGCIDGTIVPGENTILGPSTGNFGIGVSYICKLMGYDAIIIMPDSMSVERYERIKKYGASLDLTKGSESDVILTLERTNELKKNPKNRALAQFELFPNYRFHRYVTGNSAIMAASNIGNERISVFCSAPGSAGTLAAGDEIKKRFPECKIAAIEPYECSTLADGGRGQHRIEGIGDKMCTLIHNVGNTDFIVEVKDEECIQGLKVIHDGNPILREMGVSFEMAEKLKNLFGPSGICNIIGAIKMAKFLKLGPSDNVVTVATDSFDRYESVIQSLNKRYLEVCDFVLRRWAKDVFINSQDNMIYDVRGKEEKERLYLQKEKDWLKFNYSKSYLDSMKQEEFWEKEYYLISEYNKKLLKLRTNS